MPHGAMTTTSCSPRIARSGTILQQGETMSRGVNVLALVKGSERYIFLYDDDSAPAALQQFSKYAANPDLSFTWYDAALLSQKVRQMARDERLLRVDAPEESTSPTELPQSARLPRLPQ
jgi:bifunctional ADP-heptose synthase (sugar kinase/adenylyltransferase)